MTDYNTFSNVFNRSNVQYQVDEEIQRHVMSNERHLPDQDTDDTNSLEGMGGDSEVLLDSNESNTNKALAAYEKCLARVGFTFRLFVIIACSGIGLLSDTLEVMSISYAKDHISKDFNLTRQEESTLSGVLFGGMLIGGLFWGTTADIYGRRKVLLVSLTMNGLCAGLSALSVDYYMFISSRFFSGVGVGGSIPIIFSYVSEWVSSSVRGRVISAVATCWMFGTILAAGLAWIILPDVPNVTHTYWVEWRYYLVICSLPSLIAVLLYAGLDESPIWLAENGKIKEALQILKKHGRGAPQNDLGELKRLIEDETRISPVNKLGLFNTIKQMFMNMVHLFAGSLRRITLILMCVILPVHFGYYGFMLWLPEYLQKGDTEYIKKQSTVYRDSTYIALAALPGNLLTVLLTDKVGPKPILVCSLTLSAGSVFLLWELNSKEWTVLLSCLFNMVSTPVFNMVDFVLTALYSTDYRSTAFGFHTSLIRIASIIATWFFSYFIDTSPTIPILCTAVLILISAGSSFFLPPISSIDH